MARFHPVCRARSSVMSDCAERAHASVAHSTESGSLRYRSMAWVPKIAGPIACSLEAFQPPTMRAKETPGPFLSHRSFDQRMQ